MYCRKFAKTPLIICCSHPPTPILPSGLYLIFNLPLLDMTRTILESMVMLEWQVWPSTP